MHRAHYFGLYEFKLYKPYIFHVLYYYYERVCASACRPAPVFFCCPRSITQFINEKDEVTAVTGVGTATAAAQTITVGTNDKVAVAKYADLSVSAS